MRKHYDETICTTENPGYTQGGRSRGMFLKTKGKNIHELFGYRIHWYWRLKVGVGVSHW